MSVRIILVGSKYEGNVGAIARSMTNFGLEELYLVDPCPIGNEAYIRSTHGSVILDNAKTVNSIEEATKGCFLVVGTSGITTKGNANYVRVPISVKEFADRVSDYEENIAILFGREDIGLLQEELALCDLLITIPSSDEFPVLNISHAATIVMYELFKKDLAQPIPAEDDEKELMFKFFDDILDCVDYPEHRRHGTSVMFRRMMGRSIPTKWEYNTIMGVFGDASKIIRRSGQKRE